MGAVLSPADVLSTDWKITVLEYRWNSILNLANELDAKMPFNLEIMSSCVSEVRLWNLIIGAVAIYQSSHMAS